MISHVEAFRHRRVSTSPDAGEVLIRDRFLARTIRPTRNFLPTPAQWWSTPPLSPEQARALDRVTPAQRREWARTGHLDVPEREAA